jgi:hypothetical protein
MGAKYIWKPDSNPPVGAYDIDRGQSQTKARIPDSLISPSKREKEGYFIDGSRTVGDPGNEPGRYGDN